MDKPALGRFDDLRVIPRTDGGPDIVADVEDRPDGTRVLRHWLPDDHLLETFIKPDGAGTYELTVLYDGKVQMDVGPAILVEDDPPAPSSPPEA